MMFLGLLIGISMTSVCMDSTQTPTLTSCSSAQQVQLSNVAITDAELGKTMTLDFTLALTTTLDSSPELKLTVTKNDGKQIACIADVGSCAYKLCGGTSSIERQIGQPWNNVCPIPASNYSSSLSFKIPYLAGFFIGDGNMHLKVAAIDGGTVVGCKEFDFTVALS